MALAGTVTTDTLCSEWLGSLSEAKKPLNVVKPNLVHCQTCECEDGAIACLPTSLKERTRIRHAKMDGVVVTQRKATKNKPNIPNIPFDVADISQSATHCSIEVRGLALVTKGCRLAVLSLSRKLRRVLASGHEEAGPPRRGLLQFYCPFYHPGL